MNPFHKTIIPRNLLLLIEKTSLYTNFAQICSNMSLPRKDLEREIFLASELSFEALALEVFRFQHQNNPVYRQFCDALHIVASELDAITKIPFLPIQFFKSRDIKTTLFEPETIFESSGTTGSINSKHLVKDLSIYEQSFNSALRLFYGHHPSRCIIGLLPSYLERGNSSLVYMVNDLIRQSSHKNSGFYLHNLEGLRQTILQNESDAIPTLLIGVTYALLDFAAQSPMALKHTIVMETGGMKGRRKELTREEVHSELKKDFGLQQIHSEYGMTELLSQAYALADGRFHCPPWMKVLMREEDDPLTVRDSRDVPSNVISGGINVIDLANVYSCSFIATDDVGKLYQDGSFEVLGRLDNSDIRGCGLMAL